MQQYCHRCAAALPVHGRPMQWCPRCGGVLSAPTTQRPVTRRWVATPPARSVGRRPVRRELGPTPRYRSTPRWGLPHRRWAPSTPAKPPTAAARTGAHAHTAQTWLLGAATILVLAAVGELWRYLLLLRSRAELLPARTVAISDSLVITAGVLAPLVDLVAMVACTLWLIRAREAAATRIDRRDTRSPRSIALGVWVPGWNLLMSGLLLTELERDLGASAAPSRLLRAWWASWVGSVVLAVVVWLWRLRDTVQARADGVLLAALSDLLAAATVVLTLLMVRRCTDALVGQRVSRRARRRRWVASVPTAAAGSA